MSILCIDVPFTIDNGHTDPAQQVNLYLTVAVSTHPGAAAELADFGGSPTPGTTGPRDTVTPILTMPITETAAAEFVPHETAPPTLRVVDNQAVILFSQTAIHGAEQAVETMKSTKVVLGGLSW